MAVALDREAHRQEVRTDVATIARYLQEVLGQRLTGVIADVADAKAVGRWAQSRQVPRPEVEKRLRLAFRITQMLMSVDSADTVRAWFTGMNPELDDASPALMIGEEPIRVLQAARTFVANG